MREIACTEMITNSG